MVFKKIRNYLLILLLFAPMSTIFAKKPIKQVKPKRKSSKTIKKKKTDINNVLVYSNDDDWELLKKAISKVESNYKESARNGDCIGILQISSIYVRQVNKILGKRVYEYKDRWSKQKSMEMFEIYQNFYNPNHDITKAIVYHNGSNNHKYIRKVMNEFNKLRIETFNALLDETKQANKQDVDLKFEQTEKTFFLSF